MIIKEIMKRMVFHYFVIFTGSLFSTYFYCNVFYPDLQINLNGILDYMIFALLGDLPLLVFYSKRELSERAISIRYVIHFLLIESILLTAGYRFKMYDNIVQGICFAFAIMLVYIMVSVVNYSLDQKTCRSINKRIQELNQDK